MLHWEDWASTSETLLREAAERLSTLEAALSPFARVSDQIPEKYEDLDGIFRLTEPDARVYVTVIGENAGNVTVADFRRARTALSNEAGK